MDFTEASGYIMPFGKHKGSTLARIGSNNDGLKYLDWLIGQDWVSGKLKEALGTYLKHPSIALMLDRAIED